MTLGNSEVSKLSADTPTTLERAVPGRDGGSALPAKRSPVSRHFTVSAALVREYARFRRFDRELFHSPLANSRLL
jgi:hypothetical protein